MVSDQKELQMIGGSSYLPKKSRTNPRGEDAHFYSRQDIIVCDGVGGWAERGIDSGVYALKLAWNTAVALHRQPKHDLNPKDALLGAHAKTSAKGSSTACVITLTGNKLRFANVGDSGFQVFRHGKGLVYESPKRQYSFNYPYQLAADDYDASSLVNEGEVEVEAGDIVLAGTDGLFDNFFVSEIENILQETSGGGSSKELARKIASRALFNSINKNYESPFQKEASLAGEVHVGGKYDDITVVVAKIRVRAANHKAAVEEEVGAEMESAVVEECKTEEEVGAEMESAVVAECKADEEVGAEMESAVMKECKTEEEVGAEMESAAVEECKTEEVGAEMESAAVVECKTEEVGAEMESAVVVECKTEEEVGAEMESAVVVECKTEEVGAEMESAVVVECKTEEEVGAEMESAVVVECKTEEVGAKMDSLVIY